MKKAKIFDIIGKTKHANIKTPETAGRETVYREVEKMKAADRKRMKKESVRPLTLDNLFEEEEFTRKGARPGKKSFIVGASKPKRLESPDQTMKRTIKKTKNDPRVKSYREYYKNKANQNYKPDPDWR